MGDIKLNWLQGLIGIIAYPFIKLGEVVRRNNYDNSGNRIRKHNAKLANKK